MSGSEPTESAAIEITGRTRMLGIFADPTAHVKAPPRINAIARRRGKDAVMVPFQVAEAHLAQTFDTLRALKSFDGGIVTVPHKTAAAKLCDRISTRAQGIGATNVIRREADGTLVGDMLDGLGFVGGLRSRGIEPAGLKACLAGAGGAANAIAFALVEAGVSVLTLSNRTRSRAEELRERILRFYPDADIRIGDKDPAGHDLIVNGTSLGMHADDPLPFDPAGLHPDMIVAEVVMEPEITPLLAHARDRGCRIHLGGPMLEQQLELMADYFGL